CFDVSSVQGGPPLTNHRPIDFFRIVLHPTGPRIELPDFAVSSAADSAANIDHHRSRAGCPLIDREHILGHEFISFQRVATSLDHVVASGDVKLRYALTMRNLETHNTKMDCNERPRPSEI